MEGTPVWENQHAGYLCALITSRKVLHTIIYITCKSNSIRQLECVPYVIPTDTI